MFINCLFFAYGYQGFPNKYIFFLNNRIIIKTKIRRNE